MKAFILERYGGADRVRAGDMPDPQLREDDVLVQVHAAGVNLLDSKIRNGEFKLILPYRLPLILGHDMAGVVVRVGSRVRRFEPGDGVYARPADGRIGAFAEFMAIKEEDVAIKPNALTMEEAASIPLVGLTAWQALIERASLKQGQKVLIQAGSGGVGTFAIQLAKHVGATVATTTSTANVDLARSLGADIVIDYKKEDFAHVLRDYDVVLHSLDRVTNERATRSAHDRPSAVQVHFVLQSHRVILNSGLDFRRTQPAAAWIRRRAPLARRVQYDKAEGGSAAGPQQRQGRRNQMTQTIVTTNRQAYQAYQIL
jgi:NADPH:quinone reductase-like Zn-dependent oxidoreductase